MEYVVRLEKFGSVYRFLKFKSNCPISDTPQKGEEMEYYGKDPWKPKRPKPDIAGGLDEGTFWELFYDMEDSRNEERLENSISRSRTKVRELALCNDWEYFATFTLDPTKNDRFNLAEFVKNFGVWIGNYNKKYSCRLKYLIIPEKHPTSGAWHAHGLLHDVAEESLVKNEHGYLDLPYYRQRFGYISLSPIRDAVRCANYISKYICKDMANNIASIGKNNHLYYASRGLRRREVIMQDFGNFDASWENEFVGIRYCCNEEEMLEILGKMNWL